MRLQKEGKQDGRDRDARIRSRLFRALDRYQDQLNRRILVVMPAEAGIHIHRPVFIDTGFRRYDIKGNL
jgi:hypothetical protein